LDFEFQKKKALDFHAVSQSWNLKKPWIFMPLANLGIKGIRMRTVCWDMSPDNLTRLFSSMADSWRKGGV
jgi:hypothetical protein